jgi:hypothetical protein
MEPEKQENSMNSEEKSKEEIKTIREGNEKKNEAVETTVLETLNPPTSGYVTPYPKEKAFDKHRPEISPEPKNYIQAEGDGTEERGRKRTITFASPPERESRKGMAFDWLCATFIYVV